MEKSESMFSRFEYKYQKVWKRALMKVKVQRCFKVLKDDICLYGTSSHVIDINNQIKPNISNVIDLISSKREAYRSLETDKLEQEIPWYMINPDKAFKKIWSVAIALAFLYTAIMMPFRLAFYDPVYFDFWTIFELTIDAVFVVDIILAFFTPITKKNGWLNTKFKSIACSYLKSWFLIDFIASLPFSLIDYAFHKDNSGRYNSLLRLIKLPRLYKLLRVARVMKAFKHYFNNESMDRLQDFLKINSRVHKLIKFLLTICLCTHVMACIWFYASKLKDFSEDTWVFSNGYINESITTCYIASIYWAFTTLTTVGYGDIHAQNSIEQILSILWMCVGVIVYSVTIGSLSSFLSSIDTKESLLASKMAAIQEFARETGISKEEKAKIKAIVRYNISKAGNVREDKHRIFSELPRDLKHQVALSMYSGFAKEMWFFKNRDPSFVIRVVQLLRPQRVLNDVFLYKEGEFPDEVYFILKGRVNLVVNGGCSYKSYLKGSHIGEIEILLDLHKRETTAQVFGDSELLSIFNNDFLNVLNEFYQEKEILIKVAKKRRELNLHERNVLIKLIEIKLKIGNIKCFAGKDPSCLRDQKDRIIDTHNNLDELVEVGSTELNDMLKRMERLEGNMTKVNEILKILIS